MNDRKSMPVTGRPTLLAFTLIEMIGILAIIAILATLIFSATTKSVDVGVSKQESTTLQAFADALQNNILRTRYLPGANDWYLSIANEMGVSTNTILYSFRNLSSPRVFMVDPNLQIGVAGGNLPYSQQTNTTGSIQPISSRVMIVSSLAPSVTLPAAGVASANFNAVWNTADGNIPTNGFTGWKGQPDDVKIQRINLAPLFVNLTLGNYPTNTSGAATNRGQYQVDGQVTNTVPDAGTSGYFLRTTLVDLIAGGLTNARLVLERDSSYFFVGQVWRNVPFVPIASVTQSNTDAANLAQMISTAAALFTAAPYNINASPYETPATALSAMSNFMYTYPPYANYATYTNPGAWTSPQNPWEPAALAAQNRFLSSLNNLQNGITQGGCTNPP
jgi:type II secretory pathway pseudopilin PulG